ncbi:MAG: hypothetical protein WAU32_15365 [Thermoanaerobaculia bacterium]
MRYSAGDLEVMKGEHETSTVAVAEPPDSVAVALAASAGPGSTIVISHNQSGGITAGTVNVQQAPEPTIAVRELFLNQATGNEFQTRVELRVDSPYPPANLYVGVRAPSIRRIALVPQRTGLVMKGHCGTRDGFAFENLQQPYGLIHLDIVTGKPERPEVEWDLT